MSKGLTMINNIAMRDTPQMTAHEEVIGLSCVHIYYEKYTETFVYYDIGHSIATSMHIIST